MHAQEALTRAATLARFAGSIPIEGDRPGASVGRPKATDGRTVEPERTSRVRAVQRVNERSEITNPLQGGRSTTDALELTRSQRRPRLITASIVVTVGVQLGGLGLDDRWHR